jgi:CRP-like cAMP-binding protein
MTNNNTTLLTNQDLLRRVSLFSRLSDAQLRQLSGSVSKRCYKRGERVVTQGQKTGTLFVILSGRARVLLSSGSRQSREVIVAALTVGDYFGEMSLIDDGRHSASVDAETALDVLALEHEAFMKLLHESVTMTHAIMRGLVSRLREADRKIGTLALMSVYGRVANALLDMAKAAPAGDMIIRERISRQELAQMVGASREMVSRVMKDFESQGFVTTLQGGALFVKERRAVPRGD